MKRFATHVALSLALMLIVPTLSWAAGIHYMQCTECHKSSLAVATLATANVCLSCHAVGTGDPTPAPGWDGVIKGRLLASQASDARDNNPYSPSNGGTSHMWGAPANNPAAGAQEPAANLTGFYRRYQVSWGKVTCTRCHEPHADGATNPLAMPPDVRNANLPMKSEQLCRDCHVPFDQTNNRGYLTHPVVTNYGALLLTPDYQSGGAKEGWLKPAIENGSNLGTVQSINATIYDNTTAPVVYTNGVGCTSCHGVHAADSDSTTGDGFGTAADTTDGDGNLLRSDGPTRIVGGDSAATAQLRSNLCRACHTFKTHGNSGTQMGCLDCHSGHTYGSSNYFVLRNQVGATSGLNYTSLTPQHGGTTSVAQLWSGTVPLDTAGYCEKCHGQLTAMVGSARTHVEGENCRTCHAHDGATFSFEAAGGCSDCHGAPPTTGTAGGPSGYAVSGAKNYFTASGGTIYKNEANTPHAAHSAGSGNYTFACNACHLNNSHDTGTFQDVFLGVDDPLATGSGQMSPTYNTASPGTCSAVYCHSNGGRRTNDGARTYTAATIPGWNNGSTTGAISTCNACHDGAAEMDGVTDKNSAAHAAHIARGYACNICHKDTASNNATLAAGAIGSKHVNNIHDVAFDTTGFITVGTPYNTTTGVCSVYCHSNGDGPVYAVADWDLTASGDCGACHGTAAVNPSSLTGGANGGHKIHIVDYATALSINCDDCHNHTGAFGGQHVDGTVEFRTDNCASCHGSSAPVWGDTAVNNNCSACHGMAALDGSNNVIAGGTMRDTNGDTSNIDAQVGAHGVHLNSTRANIPCATCHNTVVTNINAATGYVNKVAAAGHLGTLPADITFSAIASTNTANPQYTGGTCTVTYCHDAAKIGKGFSAGLPGTTPVPDWDQATLFDGTVNDCNNCHGYPPGPTHTTSTDCSGCHGNVVTADNGFVDKNLHMNGVVEVQGGTNCGDCHAYAAGSAKGRITSGAHVAHTTVVDGVIGNEDFSDCAACHGATVTSYDYAPGGNHMNGTTDFIGSIIYNDGGTRGVLGDDTNTNCTAACHAMANGQAAVWTATSLTCDSCHANPPANGGGDALGHSKHLALSGVTCVTCHDGTIPTDAAHANDATGTQGAILADRAVATADEASLLIAGFNDTDNTCNNVACHNPTGGAYAADWDVDTSSCNLCHGNAPTSGAHAAHTVVSGNTTSEDRSDCALCHVGAATYTYAHRNGSSAFVAGIANGGTDPNFTCTAACHTSTVGDGSWVDANSALNCNACHGNPPVNGGGNGTAHVDHLSAGLNCASCHDSSGVPTNTVHISLPTGTDGQKITDKATADAAEVQIDVATWNNTNNTCANVACHNPSPGGSYLADWDNSTSSCTLCHANTNPTMVSGSHAQHLGVSVPTTFNVSATCATCHGTVPVSYAHRNGTVTISVTGGTGYNGNVTDTTNTTWGTCSITQCHNTGDTTTPRVTPQWGRTPQSGDNCTICHNGAPAPATGDHSAHFSAGRVTAGMTCNSCHSGSASNNTTAGGSSHLNNARYDVSAGGNYSAVAVTISNYTQGSPSSCTANCHSSNPKLWEVPSTCEGCHSNLNADSTHAAHITITPSIITDTTDCQQCHGVAVASYTVAGGHANHQLNGTIDFAAGIADVGTYPDYTCSAACHSTTAGQAVLWSATSLGCDACHGNPPPTGGRDNSAHADHIAAGLTCATCHDTAGVPIDLNHISAPTGTEGQKLIDRAVADAAEVLIQEASWNGVNKTCNNTACHDPSGTGYSADWTAATGSVSDCALCHAGLSDDPGTGSHTSHRTAVTNYGNNVTCAECHAVTGDNAHRDGTVNVNGSKISSWTNPTCTTSCHSNGIAATGPTPNWGFEASSCGLCHPASPTSGSHNKHLLNGNYISGCGACHTGANNTAHINGTKSFIVGITYAPASGTCSANLCHSGSADWRDNVPTIQCVDCHNADGNSADLGTYTLDQGNWPPSSFAHTGHLNSNPLGGSGNNAQNDCYACHGNTINSSGAIIGTGHLNLAAGDLTFSSTTFRYQGVAITTGGSAGTARTCSNARCHNGVTTPTWGSGAISCGRCHGDSATFDPEPQGADETATIGSHGLHTDATVGSYTDCANCHANATSYTVSGGHASHQNLQVEIVPGTGTYSEATAGVANLTGAGINYGGDFADNGTCATVSCHYNALTPAWGTVATAAPARCDNCHNDGVTDADDNTLAGAVPSTSDGVHKRHVTNALAAYVPSDCNACHGANAINGTHTGHGTGTTSYGNSLGGYSAGACASNLCHNDAAGNLWLDSATLSCNDCHNASGKTLYVSGALTATTPPGTGKHGIHDASTLTELAAGCTACHPHAGSFAVSTHADGGSTDLTSNIDLGGSISSPLETQVGWAGTCTNSCHSAGVADDNWSTGTLECADCHSGGLIGGNHLTNGQHAKHNVSYSATYATAAANNSTVGAYDYNCANCHGNTAVNHMNNTVQVSSVGYAGSGGTCNATYCHSDGIGGNKVTPNWVGGSFTGDRCDDCHGNSPTTAAHGVHVVGIHASDVSSGAVGKLTAGSVQASAHGNSTTSTTINCNICHSSVVTMARNKLGTACVSCHTGDANNATNIMDVANKQLHVNGTKQVAFAMTAFKSKAQLRDDIATVPELNDNWTRSGGYKAAASTDTVKLTTAPNWNGTSCSSVDCHNGIQATWQAPAGDCSACHTALPK